MELRDYFIFLDNITSDVIKLNDETSKLFKVHSRVLFCIAKVMLERGSFNLKDAEYRSKRVLLYQLKQFKKDGNLESSDPWLNLIKTSESFNTRNDIEHRRLTKLLKK